MSSIQVTISGGNSALLKKLKNFSEPDKKGVNNAIAESLRTSTDERFQIEKTPEGKRWKTSIRAREKGGKTLTDSSKLRTSIKAESSISGLAVGTNDIRAATHQFGDTRTIRAKDGKSLKFQVGGKWISKKEVTVNIPSRAFLGISDDDNAEIEKMLESLFEE